MLPQRKSLPHEIPSWVSDRSDWFITICTQPRGENQLAHDHIFSTIKASLLFRQERGFLWVKLLLLMPDHLHAIMNFSAQYGMKKSITDWKRYTALACRIKWQRDFFDHRLRTDESYIEKANYIRMNPVRAGLVKTDEEWRYIWVNKR